jgi:hypothetical protein
MSTVHRYSPITIQSTPYKSAAASASTGKRLRRMRHLAHWMDNAFRIPGTQRRIGLDSLLGLVPGVGDLATTGVSAAIVLEAMRLGVPRHVVLKMLLNIGVDATIGTIPLLGDLFDFAFKANVKNVDLLEKHFKNQA